VIRLRSKLPHPPGRPPSPKLRRTRRRAGRQGKTLYVYALTAAGGGRVSVRGIAGESLRMLREGSVAAIVGEVPRPPRPTPDNLRRYDAVMQRLAARFPSLLPARFSTSFDDTAELSFVLRSRQDSLRRSLAHVRGRVQMTVRIVEASGAGATGASGAGAASGAGKGSGAGKASAGASVPAALALPVPLPLPALLAPPAPPASLAPTGSDYLRARAAAAAREREVAGFEPIRSAVRRWIRDERVEKHARIASVYHLIPRASVGPYRSAASRAASATGTHSVISGPWPPYAFASW
jgi:hypothetical protein